MRGFGTLLTGGLKLADQPGRRIPRRQHQLRLAVAYALQGQVVPHSQLACTAASPNIESHLALFIFQLRLHTVIDRVRDGHLQRPLKGPLLPRLLQAGRIVAHIGAPPGHLAGEIQLHIP